MRLFIRSYLSLVFLIPDKYQQKDVKDKYERVMLIFFPLGILHSSAIVFLFLEFPTLPSFLFSAFDMGEYYWKYLFLALECICIVFAYANILLYIEFAVAFWYTTIFWLKQIR